MCHRSMQAQTRTTSASPGLSGSLFSFSISGRFQTTGVSLASRQVQHVSITAFMPPENSQPVVPASCPAHYGKHFLSLLEVPLSAPIDHDLCNTSSYWLFLSLCHSSLPLTHALWDIFQMNYLFPESLTLC